MTLDELNSETNRLISECETAIKKLRDDFQPCGDLITK